MQGLLKAVVFLAVVFFTVRYFAENKANAMVDLASSMARDGRYEEALRELDEVQSWFSWTDAASRVEAERKIIREKVSARDQQAEWARQTAETERQMRQEQAQTDFKEKLLQIEQERAARAGETPRVRSDGN